MRLSADAAGIDRDAAYQRAASATRPSWPPGRRPRRTRSTLLEAEARRRALSVSDTLLMFLLEAHRPERYRETIRIDLRREAERLAAELGVDAEAAIAEAERLVAEAGR